METRFQNPEEYFDKMQYCLDEGFVLEPYHDEKYRKIGFITKETNDIFYVFVAQIMAHYLYYGKVDETKYHGITKIAISEMNKCIEDYNKQQGGKKDKEL